MQENRWMFWDRLMRASHLYTRLFLVPWMTVYAVTISTVIWVVSGIDLWAWRPRKRLLGGVCLAVGLLFFVGLVVALCQ